jgi:hypothetical protein
MRFSIRGLAIVLALAPLIGCEQRKSYLRDPLVRQLNVIASPASMPENATQVDPYPPVRPVLPDDPANIAISPIVQTADRTPAKCTQGSQSLTVGFTSDALPGLKEGDR